MLQHRMLPPSRKRSDRQLVLLFNAAFGPAYPKAPPPPGFELTSNLRRLDEARVVVFHIPSLGNIDRLEKRDGQIWVARWVECGEHSKFSKLRDPEFMSRFDLTMSYQQDTDVWIPYYNVTRFKLGEEQLRAAPRQKNGLAAIFMSSTWDISGRTEYLAELMNHLPVSSYGKQLRNQRVRPDRGLRTLLDTIAGYKFTLAFENALAEDYVTEKFYNPLYAGSVPVYLGAANVDQVAPADGCYIDVREFAGPRELADRLLELDADDEQYQRFFEWKSKPFAPKFQKILDLQYTDPLARLCELIG